MMTDTMEVDDLLKILRADDGDWRTDQAADCIDALAAKLAELGAERDHWETVAIARQAKQQAAEAALPAVYRLALEDAVNTLRTKRTHMHTTRHEMAQDIRALPTPTADELMARIQTGETDE